MNWLLGGFWQANRDETCTQVPSLSIYLSISLSTFHPPWCKRERDDQGLVYPFAPLKSVSPRPRPQVQPSPYPATLQAGNNPNPPTHTLMPEKCTAIFYFLIRSLSLPAVLSVSHAGLHGHSLSPFRTVAMRDVAPRSGSARSLSDLGFFRCIDNLFG